MVNLSINFPRSVLAAHTLPYACLKVPHGLSNRELGEFRRFVNRFIGGKNDLFHNHRSITSYHYRYPLVQYKVLDGKAALIGVGANGVEALQQLEATEAFSENCRHFFGESPAAVNAQTLQLLIHENTCHEYRLCNYMALNERNFQQWQKSLSLVQRAALLESCITGHILKFASAIQWQLPPKSLQVELLDYRFKQGSRFDNTFLLFDIRFRSNIILPDAIGLGKAVSHGHGLIERCKNT
ncbi:MAG: hypothetical protein KDC86_16970 [Saprospiraceae bacterium]|nr:hypothetical protein [Saprospiraceae bacterium]